MPRDFELSVRSIYEAILRDGDIAVDVGAHTGGHAVPIAATLFPSGRVYAVEPLPRCRRALKAYLFSPGVLYRQCVKVLGYALSNYAGRSEYVVAVDAPWFSGLRERTYDTPTRLEHIPVRVRTFDSLFLELPKLNYIKVDAEGGEYHIFLGAAGSIDKFRPVVTFEFGVNSLAEYRIAPADMAAFWYPRNYRIFDVNGQPLATPEDFIHSAERQQVWDYVCIPAERPDLAAAIGEALREPAMSE